MHLTSFLKKKHFLVVSFSTLTILVVCYVFYTDHFLNLFGYFGKKLKFFGSIGKKPPVIVRPIGGLGNQMFQYAAAYSLAKKRNSNLYLCLKNHWQSSMNAESTKHFNAGDRSYLLWAFEISYDDVMISIKDGLCLANEESDPEIKNCEPILIPERDILKGNVPDHLVVQLSGYFESETFFQSHKGEILQRLSLKTTVEKQLESAINRFASHISRTESVAIHVRRKDFASEKRFLPISYYQTAISRMNNEIAEKYGEKKDIAFFVFSDDIDRVKTEFAHLAENFVFVSNKDFTRLVDFMLMTMCKHIITANSTFSWWAAYLNNYGTKIIIAPLPKFRPEWYESQDEIHKQIYGGNLTYPHAWITVNPFPKER